MPAQKTALKAATEFLTSTALRMPPTANENLIQRQLHRSKIRAQLVFMSSTALDLHAYRNSFAKRLEASSFFRCLRHEDSGPADLTAVEFCREAIQSSDIYVGLIGLRRGFEPDGRCSITEMEFDWAGERGIPRMVWLTPDNFVGAGNSREADALVARQQAFRERVRLSVIVSSKGFGSPEQLALEMENHLLAHLIAGYYAGGEDGSGNSFFETQVASAFEQAAANQNFDLNQIAENPEAFDPVELLDHIGRHVETLEAQIRANPGLYGGLNVEFAACLREMAALASLVAPERTLSLFENALKHDPGHILTRLGYGDWLRRTGQPDAAEKQYVLARQNARAARQKPLEAQAYFSLALLKGSQGHRKAERRAFERLIPYFRDSHDLLSLAGVYAALGHVLWDEGRLEGAEELFKKAEAHYRTLKRENALAEVYSSLASLYDQQSKRAQQKEYLLKALEIALNGQFTHELVVAYQGLAQYALDDNNHEDCKHYIEQAYSLAIDHELTVEVPDILKIRANLAHLEGQSGEAIELLERAIGIQRSLKEAHAEISTAGDLASIYIDLKEFDIAEAQLRAALSRSGELETAEPQMRILAYLGDLEAARKNSGQARFYYRKSRTIAKSVRNQYFIDELTARMTKHRRRYWPF